jgi:hypothetical protein
MNTDGLKHDPLEDDPRLRRVIAKAELEAELKLADVPRSMGFCHLFWETQKEILREKYGIDCRTPAEMNPEALFD